MHHILRAGKTQPAWVQIVLLSSRIHHGPDQIVAHDSQYQFFGDHVHAVAAQYLQI